jgi:hypothetical protein
VSAAGRSGRLARAAAAAESWWYAPAPAERLAAIRVLVGGFAVLYLAARFAHLAGYARFPVRDFAPVGIVSFLDRPAPAWLVTASPGIALVLALAFATGWRFRITGPLFAAALLWVTTYRNSWGMIFHTENLLVLHVCVLACVPAADAFSFDRRRAVQRGAPVASAPPSSRFGWPLRLLAALAVATYLLAGIAKLRFGGVGWLDGQVLRDTIAADNLRKLLLGSTASPLAPYLVGQIWPFAALAVATLVVELGAPLALVHRRLALVWAGAAIGFHVGVLASMAIFFPYPMSGIAFAPLFRAERPVGWIAARIERARGRR